ncbi:MAG: hypothetical protein J6866_06325, partial [Victivallales bacterium]|nr:hypothetical protein [Victivallales bacterium]
AAPPATVAKVSIDGLAALTVPLTDGKGQFRVNADKLSVGSYPVTCRVEDAQGQELTSFHNTLRKVPPAEHEVLVDEHQAMLVDGKPFFPVVEYRTGGTGSLKGGFYHRARHGINTVVLVNLTTNEKRNLALLDKLDAVGMKCVIETWAPSTVTPESQRRFKERFNAIVTPAMRKHPALLAYFTNDEPFACSRNPAPIIWCYNYLQETDPYHPVWVGQSPRDVSLVNLRPYADGSDITGIDIYPVPVPHPHCDLPDKSLNCLGEYTRIISEVVYNRKPVWMTVQAFAWHDHNFPQDTRRCVYPTEDETRFMAFDALFNGSRALVLYGTTTIKSLPYFKLIRDLTEELRDLSGLLARSVALDDLPSATLKVRMARRAVDGKVYYGIFNQEPQEKTLVFEAESPLIIYREARRLVPKDGKITVKLRPYEVIICGENPLPPPVNSRPPCNPELEDTPDPAMEIIWNKNGVGENIFASQYYRGQANWIWNRDQVQVKSSSCVLYKHFDLEKLPVSAKLLFCADDEADAFLNGQRVGNGDEHGRLHEYDVTTLLKTGKNLLLINARDGGGLPCAMLAELQADGQPLLVTDNSWQARATVSGEDFSAQEQTLPTTPALIVAPAGQGPWRYPLLPDSEME